MLGAKRLCVGGETTLCWVRKDFQLGAKRLCVLVWGAKLLVFFFCFFFFGGGRGEETTGNLERVLPMRLFSPSTWLCMYGSPGVLMRCACAAPRPVGGLDAGGSASSRCVSVLFFVFSSRISFSRDVTYSIQVGKGEKKRKLYKNRHTCDHALTLSLLRVVNLKFPLHPHQKYYIARYEELGVP